MLWPPIARPGCIAVALSLVQLFQALEAPVCKELIAIYSITAAGRSKCSLEPARSRRGTRNGCSSPFGAAVALEMAARARFGEWGARNGRASPPRSHRGARNGCSSPPRSCKGAPTGCSSLDGAAVAFKNYARNYCSEKLPLFGCSLNHFALLNFASCMDMHGFALVYLEGCAQPRHRAWPHPRAAFY